MDALQLSLPIPTSMDEMYIDQAMFQTATDEGFRCFSAYTPYGIKQIDHSFCRRIQAFQRDPKDIRREILFEYLIERKRIQKEFPKFWRKDIKLSRLHTLRWDTWKKLSYIGEDPKKLKDEILDNTHLHACIKQNLIENLDRILIELGLSVELSPCR
jgi:hypothetical protein